MLEPESASFYDCDGELSALDTSGLPQREVVFLRTLDSPSPGWHVILTMRCRFPLIPRNNRKMPRPTAITIERASVRIQHSLFLASCSLLWLPLLLGRNRYQKSLSRVMLRYTLRFDLYLALDHYQTIACLLETCSDSFERQSAK